MDLLAIDAGSSSIKAAVLRNGRITGRIARRQFPTQFDGMRAEVVPAAILRALRQVIGDLGRGVRRIDAISLATMSPSWVAMDARGNAITPIITHQDRRSVEVARDLEQRLGKERHLQLAGNRPFPGGISSTTLGWYLKHEPLLMRQADLIGHLSTFLHRKLTGARVVDPSHASFMGLYSTLDQSGWSAELCAAVGLSSMLLPDIIEADRIGGRLTHEAAQRMGLTEGTPMMAGLIDTSAAMLLTGARVGQLLNVAGSTDVLGLCTSRPVPHEKLLTRALGVGRKWMSVSTLAAAGSALNWVRAQFFGDFSQARFHRLLARLAGKNDGGGAGASTVCFEPYLAGDRMSMEQKQGAFMGLTLSTTREDILAATIEALARASAARLPLLALGGRRMLRSVVISGGVGQNLGRILHRDWPGRWEFKPETEATLRGLGTLIPRTTVRSAASFHQ